MKVLLKANAKINLTLDVCGILPDGYHSIKTVFQSVGLYDTVTLERSSDGFCFDCTGEIPDSDNICIKAAELFFKAANTDRNVKITVVKQIPVSAGLAGGSTDAAAVLIGLNEIYGQPLSFDALTKIGLSLGADVPFCLTGGTALGEGIGEKLTKLPTLPDCDIILIKKGIKPSTGRLYGILDSVDYSNLKPDTAAAVYEIKQGNLKGICENVKNVFRSAWGDETAEIISDLKTYGALCAELSGSGPTVFGIFNKGKGSEALSSLQKKYENVYLCPPADAPEIITTE